jgi:hypothetical protein
MLDQRFRFEDLSSFRADGETSAETRDTNGDPVRVSFDLQAPPGSSRLCLHWAEEREYSWWDMVVASHLDAVLFRIEINFDGLWINHSYAIDYFIYRASSSYATLILLPRCFSTEDEADAEDASSWRRQSRMVHSGSIGLLVDEDNFVVAELLIEGGVKSACDTAPLEAKLFRLYSSSSPEAANGGGQWELTHARSHGTNVSFLDVAGWETHRVIPFASYLCWADYNRGVLFCNVRHKTPELRYLRLPVDDMPNEKFPKKYSRTVCVTDKGETMKFVKVVENSIICPTCKHGSGFTISVWTLVVVNDDDMVWVEDVQITDSELWAMEGYNHDHLPRRVPQFPLVSMNDPHILYFVLRGTPAPTDQATASIVTLDLKSKTVLSSGHIKGYGSVDNDDNISSGFGFFPTNFSNYLTKHTTTNV